jgi:ectoine hydroxylase-related dioxygenase (phytanoyl-CoA dioxygenase family)
VRIWDDPDRSEGAEDVTSQSVASRLSQYERDGFVVLPELLDPSELAAIREAIDAHLRVGASGRNDFEGRRTQRIYSLVGRGECFARTVEHPAVLALVDQLLDPGYLLTASQAICIWPGETPQPIHYDDTFYPLPRPRRAVSVSTIWAVDDFTGENGATEVVPGSHAWGDEEVAHTYQGEPSGAAKPELAERLVPVEMSAGSCVVFSGTLLHRGGAHDGSAPRRAFSHQYCQPWARQQENFFLSIPRERARRLSPRIQQMLGYSIHGPFMGQVAGRHPRKTLEPGYRNSLEVDDEQLER